MKIGTVYLLKNPELLHYKIGVTVNSVESRLINIQTGNSIEIEIIQTFQSPHFRKIETMLHRRFSHLRLNGEWFELDDSIIENFIDICQTAHNNFEMLKSMKNPFIK